MRCAGARRGFRVRGKVTAGKTRGKDAGELFLNNYLCPRGIVTMIIYIKILSYFSPSGVWIIILA